ncbi:MAG: SWIB/MDM2 domain-containing protein [Gammaproteobacteria bacterium]
MATAAKAGAKTAAKKPAKAPAKKPAAKKPAAKAAPAKKAAAPAKKPAAAKAVAAKPAAKKPAAKKPAAKKSTRQPSAAFMKALTPSAALAVIVGDKPLPRTEVVKKVWEYIKKGKLQDDANRKLIKADAALREIFGKAQADMFEMTKLISKHLQ